MFKKFLYFIAWLGIFLLSLIGINFVLLPTSLLFSDQYLGSMNKFQFGLFILTISIIYIIICLIKFFSLFERNKDFKQKTNHGTINISASTVADLVTEIVKRDDALSNVKVKYHNSGRKAIVNINTAVVKPVNVMDKTKEVQENVKTEVRNMLGIELDEIKVNLNKINTSFKDYKSANLKKEEDIYEDKNDFYGETSYNVSADDITVTKEDEVM